MTPGQGTKIPDATHSVAKLKKKEKKKERKGGREGGRKKKNKVDLGIQDLINSKPVSKTSC